MSETCKTCGRVLNKHKEERLKTYMNYVGSTSVKEIGWTGDAANYCVETYELYRVTMDDGWYTTVNFKVVRSENPDHKQCRHIFESE